MRAPIRITLLPTLLLLVAADARAAAPAFPLLPGLPSPASSRAYVDGGQQVRVFPSARTQGKGRRAVTLVYESGRSTEAEVDATALIQAADVDTVAKRFGLTLVKTVMASESLHVVRGGASEDGVDVAARLAGVDGVTQAVPNLFLAHVFHATRYEPNDTYFPGQWFFEDIGLPTAWPLAWGDPSVTVSVIDTGCNPDHPDLEANLLPGYDAVDDDDDPSIPSAVEDEFGASHGTACAGLVAAVTDNEVGVAGACPGCTLSCVRLLPIPNDFVSLGQDVEAFSFVIDSGAAVASNSWGFQSYVRAPSPLVTAIRSVLSRGRGGQGTVVVFAAGNENRETFDDEISGLPGVLSVGVVTHYQEVTSYSNYGAPIDLVAPIGSLTTDLEGNAGDGQGNYTGSFGGTSSACPIVAGVAGLVASARPDLTGEEVTELLVRTAKQVPYARPNEDGHDDYYGHGLVDPTAALKDALGIVDPPDAGNPDGGAIVNVTLAGGGCGCDGGAGGAIALVVVALGLARRRGAGGR